MQVILPKGCRLPLRSVPVRGAVNVILITPFLLFNIIKVYL